MSEKAVEVLQSIDYHQYVPEFLPVSFQNTLHDLIDEFDVFKVLRLLIIVYFYIILRRTYTNYAKRKQVERELEMDKRRKEKKLAEPEPEQEEEETSKKIKDDNSWGWGKTARRKVQKQEAVFAEKLKELEEKTDTAYNPDSDNDIEDLLED